MISVMSWQVRTVLVVGAAVVTLALLRWRASVRGRHLPRLMASTGASWAALGRVFADGAFLDHDRRRRGLGPRGTMLVRGDMLEWHPDQYQLKHGDQTYTWRLEDVRALRRRRRRDVSGISFDHVVLEVPEGVVTIGLFHPAGLEPTRLQIGNGLR